MAGLLIIFSVIKMRLYQRLTYLNHLKENFSRIISKKMPKKHRKDVKRN